MSVVNELKKNLDNSILSDEIDRITYSSDASYFKGGIPRAVALPNNTSEVSKVMSICDKFSNNVVVRGGGTSLTGASVPDSNSIVMSLMRMNRIYEINPQDSYVETEAGIRLDELNKELSKIGFMYPPDPGSSIAATVGGSISTNAGGLRGATYGSTKNWVLGLEVVLPNGDVIRTGGKTLKRSAGYDLTSLFIGSEGSLGVITKAYLKIVPKPEKVGRIMIYYDSIEKASQAIGKLKSNGIIPLIAEFMDKIAIDSISNRSKFELNKDAKFLIIIDISSTAESIERKLKEAIDILKSTEPIQIIVTQNEQEMQEIYKLRKGLYASELEQRSSNKERVIVADIVVPPSRLPEALGRINELINANNFKVSLFGHIGDGNIHANIFYNQDDSSIQKKINNFMMEFGKIALSLDGSVSAEHGIGLEKKELLLEEMKHYNSERNIEIMKGIKAIIDPKGILNRGKIF